MVGRIRYVRERGRISSEMEYICGITVLAVTFCEPKKRTSQAVGRRVEKVERIFRKAGVTRVILPADFPHAQWLKQVQAVDSLNLYRCAADLLTLNLLARRGIAPHAARVALAGSRLCPELCEAARRLCCTVRELRIDVPGEEGELFAQRLQREVGLPVLPVSADADVTVSFGPTDRRADLSLWGKEPGLNGVRLKAKDIELPPEIEQPVLALLWEQGRLRRESLRVVNIP